MKGFNDLKTLEFGTVIYDTGDCFRGEKGIVGILEDCYNTPNITVIWESAGAIKYTYKDDLLIFSLEKPKKKVVKELTRYVTKECLQDLQSESWIERHFYDDQHTQAFHKIVITFETEE